MSPFAFGFFLTEKVAPHNRTFQVPDEQLDRVLAGLGSPRSFSGDQGGHVGCRLHHDAVLRGGELILCTQLPEVIRALR